ncbi:MAG: formimidoylglutamase [Phycisphaerales bacterium]
MSDTRIIPNTTRPEWPEIRAGADRFAATIRTDDPDGCAACLLGLPDDLGVKMNHGRPGARNGPAAIRRVLTGYGTTFDLLRDRPLDTRTFDAGDIVPADPEDFGGDEEAALRVTHDRVTEAALAIHQRGMIPVCIGGGHDLTFPTVRALATHTGAPVGGLNFDAHLDVRAEPGSGMPFRALIDGGHLDPKRFCVFGAARFATSRAHADWLTERGGHIVEVETALAQRDALRDAFKRLNVGDAPDAPAFVTIDLDAIDGSQAPGVSATNPMGLSVAHAVEAARRAAAHPGVRHFDVMEHNPDQDRGARTARVAALIILTFLAGLADRWS